ncbi:MAG TPA: hypothetical protein PLK38_06195, partial [Methanoregulaceae archaeon]|nr:hypothetical protein [Methanoregulaceae archaeon]
MSPSRDLTGYSPAAQPRSWSRRPDMRYSPATLQKKKGMNGVGNKNISRSGVYLRQKSASGG